LSAADQAPDSGCASLSAARNIESILKLEKQDEQQLSPLHRLSHGVGWFVGTIHFLMLQCALIVTWIAVNLAVAPAARFDPFPFSLLSSLLSLEAVLLTSFVLIRQNTNDRQAERRNHLDLQINLLAEEEATQILSLLRRMAEHMAIPAAAADPRCEDLARQTEVTAIARHLRAREEDPG